MTSFGATAQSEEIQSLASRHAARIGLVLTSAIVRTRQDFEAIAADWQALEQYNSGAILFQGTNWCRAVFEFEAARANPKFDPVIATLAEHGQLKAVLPLERVRAKGRTVLMPLGHAFAQYSDVLVAPDLDPRTAIAKMLKSAINAAPCDAVSFLKVRSDSTLAAGMPKNHLVTGSVQGAPYVALSDFADYQAYFATIKPKTRKNMRNDRNRLERDGPVEHHVAADHAQTLGIIGRTLEGRAERLKDQGLTSRAFRDGAFLDFCMGLPGQSGLELLAMSLRHNGKPIAEQWGFVHNNRYYAFVASRDFGNSDESPGKLHLGEVIHACSERGLVGADLMVPVMPYKLTWATNVIEVTDYALPVTPLGQLVLRLWDRTLRPLFKQAVLRMPKGLRGALMKASGRSL
ncbi:GNAT family N-acetyltransferase [Devosia sp.]|uniref:GNAT family N-acetyltransferase n=1 Tax=Devosia sp. TaxID=1871048 RepID=UPI003265B7FB